MATSPVLPKLVGSRVKRREDPRLIQGKGTYVDDVKIVGMQHVAFKRGQTDIGYGLRPDNPLQKAATGAGKANDSTYMSFEDYARFVSDYTIEKAAAMSERPNAMPSRTSRSRSRVSWLWPPVAGRTRVTVRPRTAMSGSGLPGPHGARPASSR